MNVAIRQSGAEERPVRELAYGAHDIPAGAHRIKTPDGQLRDIDAEGPLTITVLRPSIFPKEGPGVSVSLRSKGRDCCYNFFARRSHDIDCPDGRPVPEELAPFMNTDAAVVAFFYAYQRGAIDEAAMWRALAVHQTKAAAAARKIATDALTKQAPPIVIGAPAAWSNAGPGVALTQDTADTLRDEVAGLAGPPPEVQ